MKRLILTGLSVLAVLSILGPGFVFFSSPGLQACLQAADWILPGRLSADSVRGRLADRFTLEGVRYVDQSVIVAVDSLSLFWSPTALLGREIVIRSLESSGADIALAATEKPEAGPTTDDIFPLRLSLPLSLRVNSLAVREINLSLPGESRPVHISTVSLESASILGELLWFEQATVTAPSYRIAAGGQIEIGDTSAARFSVSYLLQPEGYRPIEGTGEIEGSPAGFNVSLQLSRPFAGGLTGTVIDLLTEAGWEAELRADRAELAAINGEWPDFILSHLEAGGSGTLAAYSLEVRADTDYGNIRDIHLQTAINGDAGGLRLSGVRLSNQEGYLAGEGTLDWRDDFTWQAELNGTAVNLAAVNQDWPDMILSPFAVSGSGVLDSYRVEVEAEAAYAGMEEVHLAAVVEGDGDGMRFPRATLSHAEAVVSGEGGLSWKDDFTWQVMLDGKGVDPSLLRPQWPGRLNFRGRTTGMLRNGRIGAEVHLESLDGELRGYPLRASAAIGVDGDNYLVKSFVLDAADSSVELSGRYADTVDLRFAAHSPDINALWPDASGSVEARGEIRGDRQQPELELDVTGESLSFDEVSIGNLAVDAAGNLSPEGEIRGMIAARELSLAGLRLEEAEVELNGLTEKHLLQAKVRGGGTDALLVVNGGLRENNWQGRISAVDITSDRYGSWRLPEPAELSLGGREISLARLCLSGRESALICLAGEQHDGPWRLQGDIRSLPLWLVAPAQHELYDIQGLLTGLVDVEGDGAEILSGRLDLSASDASLRFARPGKEDQSLTWQDNSIQAVYGDGRLNVNVKSVLEDGGSLLSSLTLSDFHPFPFTLDAAQVDGSLEIRVADLQPLTVLTYPHLEPSGSLLGRISFQGPAAAPGLNGTAELIRGKMIIPALGITLDELNMTMKARDQEVGLHLSGKSGGGAMHAETQFSWPCDVEEQIIVDIRGDRFEMVNSPELRLWVSPELNMKISPRQAELEGKVLVPEASITPRNLSGTVSPSRDVVVVDAPPDSKPQTWALYTDVMVTAGDNVRINAFGLKGKVEGQLRVVERPSKPVVGEGVLQVKEGTFAVYGRELNIATGRLFFSGGPIDNPGIEVRAENTASGVTTGIQVSGFLREPEISFYSSPPMEEQEIISRLLMNTSLIGSSGDEGGFLGGMTEDTGMDQLSATVQEIRESLNVDDIRIETGKAREDLSLVIGTWLTPSLYVSYGKNLLKESGSFNTRYQLGHGFFMETETGSTQSGVDLKYEIEQ